MSCSNAWPALQLLLMLMLMLMLMQLTSSGVSLAAAASVQCLPGHAAALLQLKRSFSFDYSDTTTLQSWQAGTDCCLWEGVGCNASSGEVTALDLGGQCLYSYGIDGALFNLTSLQRLDLSGNDFGGSHIPATGFEKLTSLTHLNLSQSGSYGQIPISIAYLTNLISLDLSNKESTYGTRSRDVTRLRNRLMLLEPSFTAFLANLTNLKELYLDEVDVSASGEEWCNALATHAPRLEILSLESCNLYGPIHSSLSGVRSLIVINLSSNSDISGEVPDFFADFLNLSVLQLGYCDFHGLFPPRIFQLKHLRVLDVAYNLDLMGHLPDFLNGSSLERLNMVGTSFHITSPSIFSNLKSLKELGIDVSLNNVTGLLPSSFQSLQKLQLSQIESSESSISWVGDLTNITDLVFLECNFSRTTASWIGNLSKLRNMAILGCVFSGPIPSEIANLKNLTSLTLSDCGFSGRIPTWIGNLSNLRNMEIFDCIFPGPIPSEIANLKNLKILTLQECGFSGRIPAWVANFTQLTYLDLSWNRLSGEIPYFVFTLPALQKLHLSENRLSGQLRDFPTWSSSLAVIDLSGNQFGGSIPKSFFQLKSLEWLSLAYNNLKGQVELNSFLRLRKLMRLDLSNNKLSLTDGQGVSLPFIPGLQSLGLASCNLAKIPDSLQLLHYVYSLDISNNHISGRIPKWMWFNWSNSLYYLNLSHNMFSSLELSSSFLPTKALISLDLSSNRLQGGIPMPLSPKPGDEQFLDYSNNRFSSIMQNCTSCLSQTFYLKISNNRISGQIPQLICNASKLQALDLSNNSFSGMIPSCLIQNGHLSILNLRDNHLEGRLVSNIEKGCALQTVNLNGNRIKGQLPRSLTNCKDLEFFDVGNNQIIDSFPYWLGKLPKLRILVLRSNQFHGSIGNPLGEDDYGEHFATLQIIDVASNNLSQKLSPQWFGKLQLMIKSSDFTGDIVGQNLTSSYQDVVTVSYKGQYITFEKIWTTLKMIDFSDNTFSGVIPESIGRLAGLHGLNLSHNMLTGKIPTQLAGMTDLESLDLSSNQLSGEIPEELTELTYLGTLNLSNNQLVGRVPESHQFDTFQNNSYGGNAGLCGAPLSKQCDCTSSLGEAQQSKKSDPVDVILFLFVGIGFGAGFAAAVLIKPHHVAEWYKAVILSQT